MIFAVQPPPHRITVRLSNRFKIKGAEYVVMDGEGIRIGEVVDATEDQDLDKGCASILELALVG